MSEQPDLQARAAEVKRQLEALAGHEIDATPEQLVWSIWLPVSAKSFDLPTDPSQIFWRSPLLPGPRCVASQLLDLSGASRTGADGQCLFLLSDFLCSGGGYRLSDPINVVATPRSSTPCFLTLTYQLFTQGETTDIRFNAFTWNADGTAAPDVLFDWRCRVVAQEILY